MLPNLLRLNMLGAMRYYRWRCIVPLMLIEAMAARSISLTGSQPNADAVRVVHLIADRVKDITWTRITSNVDLVARRPFPNWMENDVVEYSPGVQQPMKPFLLMFNDNLIDSPWVHNARSLIEALIERPRVYVYEEYCLPKHVAGEQQNLPTGLFKDVKADCISDVLMDADSMFVPHPCMICGEFGHDTGGCPNPDEIRICCYCRLEGHDLRVCRQLNGYCIGCEKPGHMMHHHDAPLNIYESLENFKVLKKFGLHSSQIQGTPRMLGEETTIKVVCNVADGSWKMKWTIRGEVLKSLGYAPGIAPGRPQR
jgi:hypothetical protein